MTNAEKLAALLMLDEMEELQDEHPEMFDLSTEEEAEDHEAWDAYDKKRALMEDTEEDKYADYDDRQHREDLENEYRVRADQREWEEDPSGYWRRMLRDGLEDTI